MSKAPPIPPEQRGASGAAPDVSGQHGQSDGHNAKSRIGDNPANQGQSANTFKNAPRWGKTQDR